MRAGAYGPGNTGGWTWTDLRNINYFLDNNINPDIPDETRLHYDAIARFFRAWFYFEKVKRYGDVPWIDTALDVDDPRLFADRDPRAEVLSRVADEMSAAHLQDRHLFDLARAVEPIIVRVLDEVKPGRNLKTNVEFYTALVLQSLGLKPRSFVATFACGRVAGWCAHIMEQHAEDHLIRPQSEYTGPRGLTLGGPAQGGRT